MSARYIGNYGPMGAFAGPGVVSMGPRRSSRGLGVAAGAQLDVPDLEAWIDSITPAGFREPIRTVRSWASASGDLPNVGALFQGVGGQLLDAGLKSEVVGGLINKVMPMLGSAAAFAGPVGLALSLATPAITAIASNLIFGSPDAPPPLPPARVAGLDALELSRHPLVTPDYAVVSANVMFRDNITPTGGASITWTRLAIADAMQHVWRQAIDRLVAGDTMLAVGDSIRERAAFQTEAFSISPMDGRKAIRNLGLFAASCDPKILYSAEWLGGVNDRARVERLPHAMRIVAWGLPRLMAREALWYYGALRTAEAAELVGRELNLACSNSFAGFGKRIVRNDVPSLYVPGLEYDVDSGTDCALDPACSAPNGYTSNQSTRGVDWPVSRALCSNIQGLLVGLINRLLPLPYFDDGAGRVSFAPLKKSFMDDILLDRVIPDWIPDAWGAVGAEYKVYFSPHSASEQRQLSRIHATPHEALGRMFGVVKSNLSSAVARRGDVADFMARMAADRRPEAMVAHTAKIVTIARAAAATPIAPVYDDSAARAQYEVYQARKRNKARGVGWGLVAVGAVLGVRHFSRGGGR